ncbi:hypothetical protein jhhlp_005564 [Lomentospora prolificans]|uniref:CID domain-containing protein n=1 Tax=Lomentospora prolificans TaxID=41688 RepID=A0A2N3N3G3_9PEZI|nr:hypothetical protein jhhlp_005564 [Lomentospora prolificans]
MSYENAAAEVAEDFKTALEDMTSISRIEIMNLCQIARENTEHAFEISEVLVAHINRTAPQKKLAALYVLDAIVKNVGTPYTLYVAPKLFSTFMESYARVEHPVRRKMEEMLKTWKSPIPGSMDTKPVFPADVVGPIETALIKAHNSAMQTLQQHRKTQPHILGRPPPGAPHRNTPTPPGMPHGAPRGHPYSQHATPDPDGTGTPQHQPPFTAPRPGLPNQGAHHPYGAPQQPGYVAGVNADVLNNDIEDLVLRTRIECAAHPHDSSISARLKALLDLQAIVQAGNLPQDQLVLVKKQVDELAVKMRVPQVGSSSTPNHHHVSLAAAVAPPPSISSAGMTPVPLAQVPTPVPVTSTPAPSQTPVTIDSILGKGALAALLAQQAERSAHSTPVPAPAPVQVPVPAIHTPPQPPPAKPTAASAATDPLALIAQLRQAGLLGAAGPATTPVPPPAAPAPSVPTPAMQSALASLPPVLASVLSPRKGWAPPPPPVDPNALSWNVASLQVVRPYLFPALYGELGPQCSQCGRRFKTDAEGKRKKTAHMDWHFRVRQRMIEAEKRGQYRSHYVPKSDWIKSREEVDLDYSAEEKEAATTEETAKPPEQQYIRVPDPASGISKVCPICQEQFENKWLDSAQEWVWLDAKMVGNRAYHASCHAEATKDRDRATTPSFGGRGFTPEPVLGKRKADVSADYKTLKKGRS